MAEQPLDKRFAEIIARYDEPVAAFLGIKVIDIKPRLGEVGH